MGKSIIKFALGTDLRMRKGVFLPGHSNAMVFTATISGGGGLAANVPIG